MIALVVDLDNQSPNNKIFENRFIKTSTQILLVIVFFFLILINHLAYILMLIFLLMLIIGFLKLFYKESINHKFLLQLGTIWFCMILPPHLIGRWLAYHTLKDMKKQSVLIETNNDKIINTRDSSNLLYIGKSSSFVFLFDTKSFEPLEISMSNVRLIKELRKKDK